MTELTLREARIWRASAEACVRTVRAEMRRAHREGRRATARQLDRLKYHHRIMLKARQAVRELEGRS